MMIVSSQCALCKHLIGIGPGCKAFPDGVPKELAHNKVWHDKPYPGDQGYRFEPAFPVPEEDGAETADTENS
ncbi:MAG TPA: hypothetical protein PLU39_11810 [Armatimonadota bacterium]|nr:hypothetical protein [Armatimonadota bacterium]HPT98543.1 hypothetical protein [Armatimonadota bacterium]